MRRAACIVVLVCAAPPAIAQSDRQQAGVALLQDAASHGLNPAHYLAMDSLDAGLLQYFHDLGVGRVDPQTLGEAITPQPRVEDLASALSRAATRTALQELAAVVAPQWSAYTGLRTALATYRRLAADLPHPLPPITGSIREGEVYAGTRDLFVRLRAEGDIDADVPAPGDDVLSAALVEGLRRFQARHGLLVDGILGPRTIEALQVPLPARVHQIELALERLRWLAGFDDDDVVLVNIPMFRLSAWEAGATDRPPVLSTRVIVGTAVRTPTPVFTSFLSDVVLRPFWNVPASIARGELLPRERREPNYLATHNFEIVRGDGDRSPVLPITADTLAMVAAGTARIRQRPGPANALGLIKFNFPNPYTVYMHDTPGRLAFDRPARDLSHGCVRVEDPESLAEWMLRESGWFRQAIVDATRSSQSRTITVARRIRVIISYSTAAVDTTGAVHFVPDIYRKDAALSRALQ